jgi:hypothetical protein
VRGGASVSAVNADGACALHVAAGCGHEDALTKLVELGADIYQKNSWGQTALRTAAVSGHLHWCAALPTIQSITLAFNQVASWLRGYGTPRCTD